MIASSLLLAIFLWGGNNTGVRFLVRTWPPCWTGGTRFLCAGLLMLGLLRWTRWLGPAAPPHPELRWKLWWRGGLSLAIYVAAFNWALRYTAVSHVTLYLCASPVWALLWEGRPARNWITAQRYGAAFLALAGVFVLFQPSLKSPNSSAIGEALGLVASVLWTNYGRQSRLLGAEMSGAEVAAHTMWRSGVLLLPVAACELTRFPLQLRANLVGIQIYCIVAGSIVAFAIWNNALRHWPTSQVLLFNNLIPLSTTAWAWICLREPITHTFWPAMILIIAGVLLGQTNWQRLLEPAALPPE